MQNLYMYFLPLTLTTTPWPCRVNGCDPATKEYTGKRGHVLDIVVVPGSTASDDNVREFLQKGTCPPFLHISPEHGGEIYKREAFGFEGGEELALVIVNFDGSVISPTGIVDILSKGDSCLMGWQMKRKNEPVGGGEAGVREEVKLNGAVGSRTIVGGVALDLPF